MPSMETPQVTITHSRNGEVISERRFTVGPVDSRDIVMIDMNDGRESYYISIATPDLAEFIRQCQGVLGD